MPSAEPTPPHLPADVEHERSSRPVHDELSWLTRTWELTCIVTAGTLLTLLLVRLAPAFVERPLVAIVVLLGIFAADLASGLVHWTADTWGSERMPVLGRRFVRPFRVHHVNPEDFLRRDFIDCNGDVAMLTLPFLAIGNLLSLDDWPAVSLGAFLLGFVAAGLPTNQVHQWAHQPRPPRLVAWFQRRGWILGRGAHARHHRPPYVANYCIATGWCNRPLAAIGFFSKLERAVTWCTGLRPREDDGSFAESHRPEQADRTSTMPKSTNELRELSR